MNEIPSIPPGRYRHYKGNEYTVIGTARHSETLEEGRRKGDIVNYEYPRCPLADPCLRSVGSSGVSSFSKLDVRNVSSARNQRIAGSRIT